MLEPPHPIPFLDLLGFCTLILSDVLPRFSQISPLPTYGYHFGFYCACLLVLICRLASTAHVLIPCIIFASTALALSERNLPLCFLPLSLPPSFQQMVQIAPWDDMTEKHLSCLLLRQKMLGR